MAIVLDTNVLVSGALLPDSIPGKAFDRALLEDGLLFSEATFSELRSVLHRPKFERYFDSGQRDHFLTRCLDAGSLVEIRRRIAACRDPTDDKFLEVAINGGARSLVTGDSDLLLLRAFETVTITTPVDYLNRSAIRG